MPLITTDDPPVVARAERRKVEYEQLPAGGGITRRQGRWLIILLILNTMLLAVGVAGPQIGPTVRKQIDDFFAARAAKKAAAQAAAAQAQLHQKLLAQEAQWLAFDFPPGTVLYEEDPKLAAAYLISGKGYRAIEPLNMPFLSRPWQPGVVAPMPPILNPLSGYGYSPGEGLLFVHERRTPSGAPKLVCIAFHAQQFGIGAMSSGDDKGVLSEVELHANVREPASANATSTAVDVSGTMMWRQHQLALKLPREAATVIHFTGRNTNGPYELRPAGYLRLFGGSADPADPTHFTIPYEFGTRKGTIDGWLREDAIELRGREGEMGPQSSWILPKP